MRKTGETISDNFDVFPLDGIDDKHHDLNGNASKNKYAITLNPSEKVTSMSADILEKIGQLGSFVSANSIKNFLKINIFRNV